MDIADLPLKPAPSDDHGAADRQAIIRTIQPATPDRSPSAAVRALESFVIVGVVLSFLVAGIAWASQRGDDIKATRAAVEGVRPCR